MSPAPNNLSKKKKNSNICGSPQREAEEYILPKFSFIVSNSQYANTPGFVFFDNPTECQCLEGNVHALPSLCNSFTLSMSGGLPTGMISLKALYSLTGIFFLSKKLAGVFW